MTNENATINISIRQNIATIRKPSGRETLSDENLYKLCQTYGERARFFRQKFAGLLPEVFRRWLYEKKGFSSIYEFAAKLSGMSRKQVDLVLRLERKFEDKPVLQKALTEGEISANKLVRIASIATIENQEEIFEKAKILSNRAVEVFVREVKMYGNQNENQNGFLKPLFYQKSLHVQTLKLDEDVEKELTEMQEKGIDINTFLRKILQKRKEEIEQEKIRLACPVEGGDLESMPKIPVFTGITADRKTLKITRYIPTKIRKILHQEHGIKCSVPSCARPAKIIHHTARFALTQSHDPRFLAPLCKEHHELAHSADAAYFEIKNANYFNTWV